jgi:iron complex transport system ATP-binding protein
VTAHLSAVGVACGRGARPVLRDVDLAVEHGRRLALVGPNGTGKSTLLRAMAGLDRPHGGRVLVDGVDLRGLRARDRARRIAVVSQTEIPPTDLLVREVVSLGRIPHRSPWERDDHDDALRALDRLGLAEFADRPVDRLSGGEVRRILLARALAQDADILMLDEPTNHLDPRHQHDVLRMVAGLGLTVVAAMHDLDLVLQYFNEVAVIADGGVARVGAPSEVLSSALIPRVFGVRTSTLRHPSTGITHLVCEPLDAGAPTSHRVGA